MNASRSRQPQPSELAIPELSGREIERPRLLDRLDEVVSRPLTTLTAPAGYGKTVLAAQWVRQRCQVPVAWLRLDRQDNDIRRFVPRVFDAISQLTGAALPAGRRLVADDGRHLSVDAINRLSEALSGCPDSVLVVDGLRASGPLDVYADMASAGERASGCGLHLLAVSRCIPPPVLVPLQLRGAVAHVSAGDVRLDAAETAAIVRAYSDRTISDDTAAELAERLEGWMVGTVIVGLSHPGGDAGADDLLAAAADGIDGYLTTEVINRLPHDLQMFLLHTSGVDELTGELCDVLTGRADSANVLRSLRAHGVAVLPRAGGAGTYRYDVSLRTVLDAQFQRHDAAARQAALRLAAAWYGEHQRPLEAADLFARLGDWEAVGNVVITHAKQILEGDDMGRVAELVVKAPPDVLLQHIQWAGAGAALLMSDGRVAAAHELLNVYEPHMPPAGQMIADINRAWGVSWLEDVTPPVDAAEAALAAADELGDDYEYSDLYNTSTTDMYRAWVRGHAVLGCAYAGWWDRGRTHLIDVRPETAAILPHVRSVQLGGERATFLSLAGEVRQGRKEAERALAVAADAGIADHRQTADAHYALGEAFRLSGAFDRAGEPLARALELARHNSRHNLIAAVIASQAHLLTDTGDPSGAVALLGGHRENTAHQPPVVLAGVLAAAEARSLAATGEATRALDLLEAAPLTSATASTKVAVAVALGERARARDVLGRWPRERTVIAALRRSLAIAVLQHSTGGTEEATDKVRDVLLSAHRHELIQPITEWGVLIARLLRRVRRTDRRAGTVDVVRRAEVLIGAGGAASPRLTAQQSAVLAHLDRGLSVPAIAKEMLLSANTVKTYVKTIYRKLGASTRAEALAAWRASLRTSGLHPTPPDD